MIKADPILLNTQMMQATLAGIKKVTRRVANPQPTIKKFDLEDNVTMIEWDTKKEHKTFGGGGDMWQYMIDEMSPYKVGGYLWVRETWATDPILNKVKPSLLPKSTRFFYKASYPENGRKLKWRPSIFMPRLACRLILQITDVGLERVQDITFEGIRDEGVKAFIGAIEVNSTMPTYRSDWITLWDSINLKRGFGWDSNPWVWVVKFKTENFINN